MGDGRTTQIILHLGPDGLVAVDVLLLLALLAQQLEERALRHGEGGLVGAVLVGAALLEGSWTLHFATFEWIASNKDRGKTVGAKTQFN